MARIVIGHNFPAIPVWKRYLGIPFIYMPLFATVPFMLLAVFFVKTHLRLCGAQNLRNYWSFVPTWASHRYRYDNQITFKTGNTLFQFRGFRWYWICINPATSYIVFRASRTCQNKTQLAGNGHSIGKNCKAYRILLSLLASFHAGDTVLADS